jgi:hypothetical protein
MPSVVKIGNTYQIFFLGSNNPNIDSSDWIQWKVGLATLNPPVVVVGGEAYPTNNKAIALLSWLILTLIIVVGGSAFFLRRRTSR